MTTAKSIAFLPILAWCLALTTEPSAAASAPPRSRRVLYNFDGDSCLSTKAGSRGPAAVDGDDVKQLISEVAFEGSQVDTILVCINAQVMYYPTKVGTQRGMLSTEAERATWPASEKQRFENVSRMFAQGVDPYALMLAEARLRGREALLTFRMNDDHGNDFLGTRFWVEHPDFRLGKGALDFGRDEAVDHVYSLIDEALTRYDCDGIELDFNRFPTFFRDGSTADRVPRMNRLVERVRKRLDQLEPLRHRALVLGVRVPTDYGRSPPSIDMARRIGCDIVGWAEQGWIDYVAVSDFLFNRPSLPLKSWKDALPNTPVYGGIECTEGGSKQQYLTPDKYRESARQRMTDGADGVYLFNFFTTREYGAEAWEPPFDVLRDLVAVPVGRRAQLFVDDWMVADSSHVIRRLSQAQKANDGKPVFQQGRLYGTVLHDQGRFRLWYRKPGEAGFGLAESADGLSFQPIADVQGIPFAGDYTMSVELDAHESDPAHRYKAAFDAPGMAAGLAHSTDGLNWTPYLGGRPVTYRAADSYNQIVWDQQARTYRLFTRTDFGPAGGTMELRGTRSMINDDPKRRPENWRIVREWAFDREGFAEAKRRQIYAVTCWMHAQVYFALLSVYEFPGDLSEGTQTDRVRRHERDVMNTYLATSRDGDRWDLTWVYQGLPLIPRGGDNAFDKDLLFPASTIVTHDDQHWIYYCGADERHGVDSVKFDRRHAVGLARLPLDRFIALEALGDQEGIVVTKPFVFDGAKLSINADASRGVIAVELLDERAQPIPGNSPRQSLAQRDELRWILDADTAPPLAALPGKLVRLRFRIQNAKLYAFQVLP